MNISLLSKPTFTCAFDSERLYFASLPIHGITAAGQRTFIRGTYHPSRSCKHNLEASVNPRDASRSNNGGLVKLLEAPGFILIQCSGRTR